MDDRKQVVWLVMETRQTNRYFSFFFFFPFPFLPPSFVEVHVFFFSFLGK